MELLEDCGDGFLWTKDTSGREKFPVRDREGYGDRYGGGRGMYSVRYLRREGGREEEEEEEEKEEEGATVDNG